MYDYVLFLKEQLWLYILKVSPLTFIQLFYENMFFCSFSWAHIDISWTIISAPEQNANFAPVTKDKTLRFVRYIRAKSTAHYTMPRGQIHSVELGFYDLCYIVQNTSLLERKLNAVHSVRLHCVWHVTRFYHCIFCLLLVVVAMGLHCFLFVVNGGPFLGFVDARVISWICVLHV